MGNNSNFLSTDFVFRYPSKFMNWKYAYLPINIVLLGFLSFMIIGAFIEKGSLPPFTLEYWTIPLLILLCDLFLTGNYFWRASVPLQFMRDEEGLTCIPIWGKPFKLKWEDIEWIEDVPQRYSIRIHNNVPVHMEYPWSKNYYFYIARDLDGFEYLCDTLRKHVRNCEI